MTYDVAGGVNREDDQPLVLLADFLEHAHKVLVLIVIKLNEGDHDEPGFGIIKALFEAHVDLK